VFLPDQNKKVLCHVVEPSYGIDRPLYCLLEHSFVDDGKRQYFKFKRSMSPIEVSVLPLLNRDGLPEKAIEIYERLRREGFMAEYDDAGSIGRRYARADEIGTPYCITIDHKTMSDDTVTIRDRDTTSQIRVETSKLSSVLHQLLGEGIKFEEAGAPI
jgi:glycyl-tRNA synthetase